MTTTTGYVCTIADLEAVVGERPAAGGLKSIRFLDRHCDSILALSTFAVVAAFTPEGTALMRTVGGPPGHATAGSPTELRLPGLTTVDLRAGAGAGLLALVPGYRETLRVNGTLRTDDAPSIEVEEAFLHCAKALIRSRLWDEPTEPDPSDGGRTAPVATPAGPSGRLDDASRAFLARSPFAALGSIDGRGHADVSPKGDPAGFVHVVDDATVAIPDRPGNRRTDTMHNLVEHPSIGILAFVPGDDRSLEIRGRARITDEHGLREAMAVDGKVPHAAIVVDVDHVELRQDDALVAAGLWTTEHHIVDGALPRGAKIWTDHVKLNDDPGLAAKAMRLAVNERMMSKGIDHDYRTNLY